MLDKRLRLLGVCTAFLVCLGCGGSVAFRQGRKAELRKDYDTALVNYEKALQTDPGNALYVLHERQARTQASLFHLKEGRRMVGAGRPDEAAGEFQKAVGIDPTNEAAAQELAKLLAVRAAAKRARETVLQQALKGREEGAGPGVVQLKPFPPEPLAHFVISGNSLQVVQTLAKLASLNVAFTSDFQPRPLAVDVSNMKIEDALRLVMLQSKSFWKAITPNTILVIPDIPSNRRDYEDEVLKTIYLSNPLAPADRTAITTALKQILGLQRIIDNPDSNAIIVRDTPAKVAAAEKMIRDLDRGKAEVLVEVAVVEADRNRIRDLGLTQIATLPLPGTAIAGLGFNPSSSNSTTTGLPLNRLGRISSADFSVVLPGAVANALLSDTHTRILQNPQVRVTDGQKAILKIGSRVPFATGSFLPGVSTGTSGFNLLASTQFQYQDVGVNLEITPRLLANGEVSLHAIVEISAVGPSYNIGGLSQPSFTQRKIEHDIRLKEGEVSLLGGLLQSQTTRSVTGLPGLGQVPLLRYLFSTEHSERIDTEVLVMLTPRVIRLPESAMQSAAALPAGAEAGTPTPEISPPPGMAPEPPGQPQ